MVAVRVVLGKARLIAGLGAGELERTCMISAMKACGVKAGLALAMVAGLASAELPSVLDRVPTDATLVVAGKNIEKLLSDLSEFNTAFGEMLPPDMRQGLSMASFLQLVTTQPGFDTDGSFAVVIEPPADEMGMDDEAEGGESVVLLLPINDFEAFRAAPFIKGQSPKMNNGVMTLTMMEQKVFLRDVDGFVVAGSDDALVRAFDGKKGRMDGHEDRLGEAGDGVLSSNDIALIANVQKLRPMLQQGVDQMGQQAQFLGAMGGGADMQGNVDKLTQLVEKFVRDGEVGVFGLDIEGTGVAFDAGAHFSDDSELAKMFEKGGDGESMLGKLPRMKYLFAYGIDTESGAMREVIANAVDGAAAGGGAMNPFMPGKDVIEQTSGYAGVLGASNAMGGAGLLSNFITYTETDDAEKVVGMIKKMVGGVNGLAEGGFKVSSTWEDDVRLVQHDVEVDSYGLTMTPDMNAAPAGMNMMMDPGMAMQFLFGAAGGPNGYIATANDGVYQTVSKNGKLIKDAIDAGEDGVSLSTDEGISKVAERMLGDGRIGEAYVSVSGIAQTVMPLLMMFGAVNDAPQIPELPPVGMSVASGDGGVTLRTYIPGETLVFLNQMGQQLGQQFGGPGMAPGGAPAQDTKPRF
ncbi:MAG: hypothetical protein CMJ31_08690 [Phycisphaerae bacterium]|nr:hypothetical protein [Phycisphaerae bacterium]